MKAEVEEKKRIKEEQEVTENLEKKEENNSQK